MSTSLYELTTNYLNALEALTGPEADDLPQEVISDTIEAMEGELHEKQRAVAMYIQNMSIEIAALRGEEDRIAEILDGVSARRSALTSKQESLKEYLVFQIQRTGSKKVDLGPVILSLRKNPPSVLITDEAIIPDDFKRVKTSTSVDKKLILEFGGCQGAEIVDDVYKLVIK